MVEKTNIAYVEPHRVFIKDTLYLFFNEHEYFYIGNLANKYSLSKFIDTATLKKNKDGSFEIDKINFRSSFIEQIDKLYDKGIVDVPSMIKRDGK